MSRTLWFAVLAVLPPALKPLVLRWCCGADVGRGVRIGWLASVMGGGRIRLGDFATVGALTVIRCDGDVVIDAHAQVSSFTLVYGSASFVVGAHSYLGPQSLVNVDEDVRIGQRTALGARAMIYTHGSWFPYSEGYWVSFGPVTVGDDVWCAAAVFLHPGVTIGNHVFVNSRSVVKGEIPGDSVVEGSPAKVLGPLSRLRRMMTPARRDAAIREMLAYFAEVELRRGRKLEPREDRDVWTAGDGGRVHAVVFVPSQPPPGGDVAVAPGAGVIFVVNRPGWTTSGPAGGVIDFTTTTARSHDRLATALVEFLKRYYGVQFDTAD
jgi:acetyltransferase-like isoleucine patch superfamily enzyme